MNELNSYKREVEKKRDEKRSGIKEGWWGGITEEKRSKKNQE